MSECQENNHKLTIFVELFRDLFGFLLSSFLDERESERRWGVFTPTSAKDPMHMKHNTQTLFLSV